MSPHRSGVREEIGFERYGHVRRERESHCANEFASRRTERYALRRSAGGLAGSGRRSAYGGAVQMYIGCATITNMLNYIWFGLMAIALVVAAINGTAEAVTRGAVESASSAVQITIGLVGIMTLWLGMMRIAEAAGLVSLVGRALRPLLRWLFPDVPPAHPAGGAIVVALAANMLGLNNAATPLGIKAMEELNTLNPDKDTATNAMVTLMAITTAGVQLVPASMIGVLA